MGAKVPKRVTHQKDRRGAFVSLITRVIHLFIALVFLRNMMYTDDLDSVSNCTSWDKEFE